MHHSRSDVPTSDTATFPPPRCFRNGTLILPDALLPAGTLLTHGERIQALGPDSKLAVPHAAELIDLQGGYLCPGFVDLHVHGGDGHDFMDGTPEAFQAVCRAHACHGTTGIVPTSTVARHDQIVRFLELTRQFRSTATGGAFVLGAHLYGPYFAHAARGCHPGDTVRPPMPEEVHAYLAFADVLVTATVAPELPGAEAFVRACRTHGVRCNVGHSHATFDQMARAVTWGVRHVDHLFCAMSDRARLRQTQTYPMRGGVFEATLFFDELTTEVIADGKHLAPELLRLALKIKGKDRLALVTDANRALDMPDGEYLFGPLDGGEPIRRSDGVGIMLEGNTLASGVMGMDHTVRVFRDATRGGCECELWDVIRMASLTPATIAGWDSELGSLTPGKRADLLVLDTDLNVKRVFVGGREVD